jgi:hypothetical protein
MSFLILKERTTRRLAKATGTSSSSSISRQREALHLFTIALGIGNPTAWNLWIQLALKYTPNPTDLIEEHG